MGPPLSTRGLKGCSLTLCSSILSRGRRRLPSGKLRVARLDFPVPFVSDRLLSHRPPPCRRGTAAIDSLEARLIPKLLATLLATLLI